jgi:hypothetical protein
MKRLRIRDLCLVAAAFALCAASLLTGCGSGSKIVEIKATSSVDNHAGQATISVSEVIDGNALVGVVLTYPDGHAELVMSSNSTGSEWGTWVGYDLPSGEYSYKVYATPASPDDPASFPTGQMVETNIAASGTFTIQ